VDLHLQPPSGPDIYYANRDNGWGFLDRDCISSCTEENISVTNLPQIGTYRLYAHYFSSHSLGPVTVRAQIFQGTAVLLDTTFVLGATGDVHDIAVANITAQEPAVLMIDAPGQLSVTDRARLPAKPPLK